MSQKIQEALSKLDAGNDNHWTADGLPRLDTVKMLANEPALTRDAVSAAAPGFNRSSVNALATATQAPDAAPEAAPVTTPPAVETAPAAPQAAAPAVAPVDDTPVNAVIQNIVNTVVPPADKGTDVLEPEVVVVTVGEKLHEARMYLSELAALKANVEAQYNAQIKKVDALILEAEKQKDGDTNEKAIQDYLASERRKLQERAQRIQALKGVDLSAILPTKSPIDVAMSRRNTRGGSRPVRGV